MNPIQKHFKQLALEEKICGRDLQGNPVITEEELYYKNLEAEMEMRVSQPL